MLLGNSFVKKYYWEINFTDILNTIYLINLNRLNISVKHNKIHSIYIYICIIIVSMYFNKYIFNICTCILICLINIYMYFIEYVFNKRWKKLVKIISQ